MITDVTQNSYKTSSFRITLFMGLFIPWELNKKRIGKVKHTLFPVQKVPVYIIPSSQTLSTKLLVYLFIRIMTALQLVSEKSVARIWYLKPDL